MCKWGNTKSIKVKIPTSISCTGEDRWDYKEIDSCIADLVEALQAAEIDMLGSCCGHGRHAGTIILADGRELVIVNEKSQDYS